MLIYLLKRLLYVLPVAFGVSIVCFLLSTSRRAIPERRAAAGRLGPDAEEMRHIYGFDGRCRSSSGSGWRKRCRAISAPPSPPAGRSSTR